MAKAVKEIKTFEERKEELIKKGKKEGFITFEELANALKGLDLDGDSLDELYNSFMENGISVLSNEDEAPDSGGPKKIEEEEVVLLNDEDLTTEEKVVKLIRKCNARGGTDNISVAYLVKESGE